MVKRKNGKKLVCKGITTKIDAGANSDIQFDPNGRFYTINHSLANDIIAQDVTEIPVCFQHIRKYQIGNVCQFYKGKNENDDVLIADFEITSQPFLNALTKQANVRYNELQNEPFISPDNFIPTALSASDDNLEPISVDGQLALTQKFAGLSLSHDTDSLTVKELSICLAGDRDLSVITDVTYLPEEIITDCDSNSVEDYLALFSSALAYANFSATNKVAKDIEKLEGSPKVECLVYNLMHKIPQIKNKGDTKMETNDLSCQQLMKTILSDVQEMKTHLSKKQIEENSCKYDFEDRMKRLKRKRGDCSCCDDCEDENQSPFTYDFSGHNRHKRIRRSYYHPEQQWHGQWSGCNSQSQSFVIPEQHCCGHGKNYTLDQQPNNCYMHQPIQYLANANNISQQPNQMQIGNELVNIGLPQSSSFNSQHVPYHMISRDPVSNKPVTHFYNLSQPIESNMGNMPHMYAHPSQLSYMNLPNASGLQQNQGQNGIFSQPNAIQQNQGLFNTNPLDISRTNDAVKHTPTIHTNSNQTDMQSLAKNSNSSSALSTEQVMAEQQGSMKHNNDYNMDLETGGKKYENMNHDHTYSLRSKNQKRNTLLDYMKKAEDTLTLE